MKKILMIAAMSIIGMAVFAGNPVKGTMTFEGHQREYILYMPDTLSADRPLVLMLHGHGGNMQKGFPALDKCADKHGFAVCYPQGLREPGGKHSTAWNVGYPMQDGWKIDDCGFMCALADKLTSDYGLDRRNVFFSGMSNGGEMCYIMAQKYPDKFAAFASLAGLMMEWAYRDLYPCSAVPFLEIHGTADVVSRWEGDPFNQDGWGKYIAVPLAVGRMVSADKCTHRQIDTLPLYKENSNRVVLHKHLGGTNGSEVRLYEVIGGKHSRGESDLNTPEVMWEFFSKYLSPRRKLYVGTYGNAIHELNYHPGVGITSEVRNFPAKNASYIALSKDGQSLFAVSESNETSGAYSFAKSAEGAFVRNGFAPGGANPCFIFPVEGTDMVITADYSGGSFSVFDTKDDAIADSRQFKRGEHVHQVKEIPAQIVKNIRCEGRYILVTDLGKNCIYVEKMNGKKFETLAQIPCPDGAGPRHMDFHIETSTLYCLSEKSGGVFVWRISSRGGIPSFKLKQTIKADLCDARGSGDLHIHPNGKWLYTSHRLKGDGINFFTIGKDGKLTMQTYTSTGIHPRNFCFSPDGSQILVACRDSRSIQIFDIDPLTGALSSLRQEFMLESDKPVCLVFE